MRCAWAGTCDQPSVAVVDHGLPGDQALTDPLVNGRWARPLCRYHLGMVLEDLRRTLDHEANAPTWPEAVWIYPVPLIGPDALREDK